MQTAASERMILRNREGAGTANASTDQPKPIAQRQCWTAGPLSDPRFHLAPTHIGRMSRDQARHQRERRPRIAGGKLKANLLLDQFFVVRAETKQPPSELSRHHYPIGGRGQRRCAL